MDANLKLQRKKRLAHIGSKLPNVNCEEPKLPPDDFVYSIMKEMDKKKNVMSYQQSQEFKSQNRHGATLNEDHLSHHKSFPNKQTKKIFSKQTFPLMKKCQTSLKHLKKNRCIPKPRAHVGSVPKPQFKPNLNVERNTTNFQQGITSRISKAKENSNKSLSTTSQPDFKVNKNVKVKSQTSKEVKTVKEKAQVEDQVVSSDDDDGAFESFVQKQAEYRSDSSDSDSDSRLIIRRKRGKTKTYQKKKLKTSFNKEVNKNVPKITSRPLSDSSESEEQETFKKVKNKSISANKHKILEQESLMRIQEEINEYVPDKVTYNANLSDEDPQHLDDFNCNSSDSESSLEDPTVCVLSIDQSQPFDHIKSKSYGNVENKVTHSINNVNKSNINLDSNSSNSVLSHSEPTKRVSKCDQPCYVRIIRDPVLDKIAMNLCSTIPVLPKSKMFHSSDDECIVLSENSDNEEIPVVSNSSDPSSSSILPGEDTEPDDCVIMCEMPKQCLDSQRRESSSPHDSSNSKPPLVNTPKTFDDMQIHNLHGISNSNQIGHITSVKDSSNQQLVCEKSKLDVLAKNPRLSDPSILEITANPGLPCQAANELPSIEDETINSDVQDFNVQIVAVHSITELNEPPFENSAPECNDVEIIDISDEMPDVQENSSVVKEEIIEMSDCLKKQDQIESAVKDHESNLSNCVPNPKILEILSTIDFECIKEVIKKTELENSSNESRQIAEEISTSSNSLPGTCIPMPTCGKDIIGRGSNSVNSLEFHTQNSKLSRNKIDNRTVELIEITDNQNMNELQNKFSDKQVQSVKNIAAKSNIKSSSKENCAKDFHTINQVSGKDTNKDCLEVETSLANDVRTISSINVVCAKEILSSVSTKNLTKETESFQNINSENPSSLDSRTVAKSVQIYRGSVCNDIETSEMPTKAPAKNNEVSNTVFKNTSRMTVSDKGKMNVSGQADNQCKLYNVNNEKSIQNPHSIPPIKKEVIIESPSDEFDAIAASYIDDLKPSDKKVAALFDLYKKEYEKYTQIKNTEMNVSAGLKLLHETQVKKLKHLHTAIQNLSKHDACLYKVNQENCSNDVKPCTKNETAKIIKTEQNLVNPKELSHEGSLPENVQVATKCDSAGPSREKLFRFMMNIKCAQCGKQATARCQGCAEVYYCSPQCGEQSWRQGHYAVCRKS